jgi:hypothetical protein
MQSFRLLAATCAAVVTLGGVSGCMHRGAQSASGDIVIDSISATRTAILRVDNSSPVEVHVYMVTPDAPKALVGKAEAGQTRSFLLDPQKIPVDDVAFRVEPDGMSAQTTGMFRLDKNQTFELVVPRDGMHVTGSVHQSTP